uniref:NADH-ubiquinone oxidoreductase chain 5 n=1 Tax=Hanleyella oldroydi TaxID=515356 RepID=A0A6H1PG68_9MOLL|nr:NADH dehydrogenase subunit 5 [Hanleyella oldroydi]QIZ12620.1 NADH dehydrogenase subunit 5 [Hanleyella oldroydi]
MFNYSIKSSNFASKFLFSYFLMALTMSMYFFYSNKIVLMEWESVQLNSSSMSMIFILDWVSMSFSSVVCFISGCVMMFSTSYMQNEMFQARFIWLVMLFVLSMNFLIFIPSLIGLLLGWDGLGLVSFMLVIYYQNPKSLGAGLITALMNRVGDVAILLSVGWCISLGHWNIFNFWDSENMWLVCSCIMLAGMTKSAQIPFSSWLPAAMAAPTPVSALVHSSTLVTAGVFLIIRFYPFLTEFKWFNMSLLIIAVMTMLMAGMAANLEFDLKKIIALSTLSQLGVMMSSIGAGLPLLALFHLYAHALFKALLFICAGTIIHSHHNWQDIRKMGQLWNQMPISTSCLNVANLALCGSPFLAGFYSKDIIIESMIMNNSNMITLFMTLAATLLTASYSIRLSLKSLWGNMNQSSYHNIYDTDLMLFIPAMMLTLGAIISGAMLTWLFILPTAPIFVPFSQKLLVLSVTLTGGILGFVSIHLDPKTSKMSLTYFSSTMWFMTLLSNNFTSKSSLMTGFFMTKMLDTGWLEITGGEGMFNTNKNYSTMNQYIQKNIFYLFLVMIITTTVFFPLYLMTSY